MDEPIIVVTHSNKLLNMLDTASLGPFNSRLDLAWVHSYFTLINNVPKKLYF